MNKELLETYQELLTETYQKDLEQYRYGNRHGNKNVLAVGWLDKGYDFPTGDVPQGFIQKLHSLKSVNHSKGWHTCPFCGNSNREIGSYELQVRRNGITYLSPALIIHYIKKHNYKPPREYIEAVING